MSKKSFPIRPLAIALLIALNLTSRLAMGQTGVDAIGYGSLEYELPSPGSYTLSSIEPAANGEVLDQSGQATELHTVFGEKITLLSFMYSSCSDINGCPLSSYVFNKVKTAMQEDAELAEHLQLVSLSFDPQVDTPDIMQLYANNFRYSGDAGNWRFLTTKSTTELLPILRSYEQDLQRQVVTSNGEEFIDISHLLKVFLIDKNKTIRNIYSVGFLHADVLINDVKSLLTKFDSKTLDVKSLSRPGDSKIGYESSAYQTDSLSLETRTGAAANLIELALNTPTGLPALPVPEQNPLLADRVNLGRKLFFDRRLSINNTVSCAMCHVPEQGFTSNEIATAVGVEGRSARRNAPTLYNIAYITKLFHDGREENLEQQVWGPFLDRNEMANPSIGYLLQKIRSFSDYDGLFESSFNGQPVSMQSIGRALASYQRTLVSANSDFDRWRYRGDTQRISASAKRGFDLFSGKAGCSSCHLVGEQSALFTDNQLHNTGLGYENSLLKEPGLKRIALAPGVYVDVEPEIIAAVSAKTKSDVGQYEVTEDPADRWKFRTPTLRNIALTAPYMHNGQFSTLEQVLEFYNKGGVPHELQSPLIRPLNLSIQEQSDIIEFLNSLTGDSVELLVSDAFAAPVGDVAQ